MGASERIESNLHASATVAAIIARARSAQAIADRWSQAQADEAAVAVGWAIVEPARNRALGERAELDRIGAPQDLVQSLPTPIDRAHTLELMRQADLVVATGSATNVRGAYQSGTPALGVGAGNVSVIVDETADVADAAAKIARSK